MTSFGNDRLEASSCRRSHLGRRRATSGSMSPLWILLLIISTPHTLLPCWKGEYAYPVVVEAWMIPGKVSPFTTSSRLRQQESPSNGHKGWNMLLDPRNESEDTTSLSSASSSSMTESSSSSGLKSSRSIIKVEKFARLPVWPVWHGVLIWIVSNIFGFEAGAKLEDAIGGRVCPNFFGQQQPGGKDGSSAVVVDTSPFIMLVHHCHSFWKFDPIRFIQKQFILAEGFPAHPHRGFTTVTYFLKGGFVHRDSSGVKQVYGNHNSLPHTQWLFTGAGLLHEEMFDIDDSNVSDFFNSRQELYQLWLNVPAKDKLLPPTSYLLGNDDIKDRTYDHVTPHVVAGDGSSETIVISGSYQGRVSDAPASPEDVCIFHVKCKPGATWTYTLPTSNSMTDPYTCIVYIRQGSLSSVDDDGDETTVPVHHTAYFDPNGSSPNLVFHANDQTGVDFMLLAGRPLNEPMAAQGSMVMNTGNEINVAYQDYQLGRMGRPWDHKVSTSEWRQHVQKYPCTYQYQEPPSASED